MRLPLHRSPALALALVLASACTTSSLPDDDVVASPLIEPTAEKETQGRYLLGVNLDDPSLGTPLEHLSFPVKGVRGGVPVTASLVGGAALKIVDDATGLSHTGTDPFLEGVELAAPSATVRVVGVRSVGAGVPVYQIEIKSTSSSAGWTDPCDGEDAVAFTGTWSRAGLHTENEDRVGFACADGVIFKCSSWDYPAGGDPDDDMWDVNQACTRMARGDHCGDGTPGTIEGTFIAFWDTVGISAPPPLTFPGLTTWPPPPGRPAFEAGWVAGALPVPCFGKARWQLMPLGDQCGGALPDPRVDFSASYCEDYVGGLEQMILDGVYFFQMSRYNDLRLDQWHDPVGGDRVTTIRGYATEVAPFKPPFRGYVHDAQEAVLMRSRPTSIGADEVDAVRMARDPGTGDRVVALFIPPPGAAAGAPAELGYLDDAGAWQRLDASYVDELGVQEGLVFKAAGDDRVELRLYQQGTDLLSSTSAPAGYDDLGRIGYVSVPPDELAAK